MPVAARRSTGTACAAAVLLAFGAITGCGGNGGNGNGESGDERLAAQRLDWSGCRGDPQPMPGNTRWECATLQVPLDYDKPDGDTIGIALIRARTRAAAGDRIGSLLFNFGGPGGSGVTTLPAAGTEYQKLHERYDLVSFDPRGVGRSEGVRCLGDQELDDFHQSAVIPRTSAEGKAYLADQRRYAEACERNSGEILPHLTTADTARDMDLMRQVLGDEELHYFGISYGTELGGVYAHLFPEKVGHAVLDAAVDPTRNPMESSLGQAEGFQLALTNYLKSCAETGECPVGGPPAEGEQEISTLLKRLDEEPLETNDPDGRTLNGTLAAAGIAQSLYSEDFWGLLTEGLDDAVNDSDGTLLLRLSDLLNGRREDGTYDNSQAALTAISCADAKPRYGLEDIRSTLPAFEEASPVFGTMAAWGLAQCYGWPVGGEANHPTVTAPDAEPIVVIGTTGDPATPYEGAGKMADRLGRDVGVELTYEGEGHGAYNSGDTCVQTQVNDYLLEDEVPEDGSVCER
jgi:pimeloyl-ACP methyl ester carboxylesterase